MSLLLDTIAARQRHEDMLREATEFRLARKVAEAAGKQGGTESLLSRMVNLLSRSSHSAHKAGRMDGTLNQHSLADAKGR